ncbi:MAG: SCP2 sterol-binding domain-containing protein [Gemmatimonadaceae bacterium]
MQPDELLRPFTQPWADRYRSAINAEPLCRDTGRTWTWPLALILEQCRELGYPNGAAVRLEITHGECHGATAFPVAGGDAPFALRADYPVWKRIVRGELDPIAAVMRRELALEGSLPTLVAHVAFTRALVKAAQAVPTDFPDDRQPTATEA